MIRTKLRILLSATCATGALAGATAAQAAQAAQGALASAPAATSSEPALVGEVIVTAQKRSERLQDVPISITALDANALKAADVKQLTDISSLTPGLQFQEQNGFTQPMIRGVGTSIVSPGAGQNVGIYLDGFLLPNPAASNLELLNISNVQVLKGPQGTLFGRNTTGGAILLTTTDPSSTRSVQGQVSYGSYNAQDYQAYVTGGGDRFALDLAALRRQGDGWLRNVATGAKAGKYTDTTVRLGAKFNVTDDSYLLLRYSHSETNEPAEAAKAVLCCNIQGRPYSVAAYIPGAIVSTSPNDIASEATTPAKSRSDAVQLTAVKDFSFARFTSYTQYRDERAPQGQDLDGSSLPIEFFTFPYADKIFTQEFILASKPGPKLQWTTGLYYFSDTATAGLQASFNGSPLEQALNSHVRVQSMALYADATYQAAARLFITAGLRFGEDLYNQAHTNISPLFGGPATLAFDNIDAGNVTPRLVIRYTPDDRSSVYASYTKGYKSGLRNIAALSNELVQPERISAYEVGYKYAARALAFNLSAYYYEYKNLQVASYHGSLAIVNNAADSRIYGVDGDAHYSFNEHFQANIGLAYIDAKYKNFPGAPLYQQCLDVSCGLGTFPNASIDLHNSQMQFAPNFTGNVGALYKTDLAGGRFSLSGNLSYQTKEYFDSAAQFANTAHEDLSLRAEWIDPSEHYTFAIFGDNLTNKRYLSQITPQSLALLTSWNAPLTVGASFGFRY